MLKVGLTGSIAVGKTFVSKVLTEFGCCVLDADKTAREVVEPGEIGWQKIVAAFGAEILLSDHTLNRAKMAEIVFSDEKKRLLLNAIVHPLVFAAQNKWLQQVAARNPKAIAVIDAALMIESGSFQRFDQLIVVWCQPEIQIERLMKRNRLTRAEAVRRIAAQMTQDEKKIYADFLIETSGSFAETRRQVARVYQSLLILARK